MPNKKRKGKVEARTALQQGSPDPNLAEQQQQEEEEEETAAAAVEEEEEEEEEGKLAEAAGEEPAPAGASTTPQHTGRRGKVDVDGRGINLAEDLMNVEEEQEQEAGQERRQEEQGRESGNIDEILMTLGVDLCESILEGLPKDGPKKVAMGYGDRQTCPALGVKQENLRSVDKEETMSRLLKLSGLDVVEVMRRLWDKEHRDYQYLVLEMLTSTIIPLSREVGFVEVFKFLEYCVLHKSGRDTVDHLAKYLLNALAYLEPPETRPVMDAWIEQDQHPWLQRAALLHQVCLAKYCDFDRLANYCSKFTHMTQDTLGFEEKWSAVYMALTAFAETGHPREEERGQDKPPTARDRVVNFINEQLRTRPNEGMRERLEGLKNEIGKKRRTRQTR